jgi:hypothetical protein
MQLDPKMIAALTEIANGRENGQDSDDPAAALTALLKLNTVGCRVVGARIVGTGSTASADIYVCDGNGERTEITFKARRDVANAQRLNVEMSCFGVIAALKAADAIQANVLLGRIATIEETASEDDAATDWGLAFLRDADTIDVDLSDQRQRWAAFSRLRDSDPFAAARNDGVPLAGACVALRAETGDRWVRSSWFYEHVRRLEAGVMSRVEVNQRMQRVGWARRRGEGRVKATHPTDPHQTPILLAFYVVPADWEDAR